MPKKKQDGPPWWANTVISVGATFGLGYLTGLGQGLSAIQAAAVAGAAALAPLVGVPVQSKYNPDGTKAETPYKKEGE